MIKKLTILLFFIFGSISAQEPIHFSTKDGLPSNNVYDVLEDKDGFIWFATNRGLSKFDGKTFTNFTIKDGLPNNDIWLLENDHKNRLWYFSKSKYQGYVQNDSIYKFKTEDDKVISPHVYKDKNQLILASYNYYSVADKKLLIVENQENINAKYEILNKKYNLIYLTHNANNKTFIGFSKTKAYVFNNSLEPIHQQKIDFEVNYNYTLRGIKGVSLLVNSSVLIVLDDALVFINDQTFKLQYYSFKKLIGKNRFMYSRAKEDKNKIQVTIDNHLLIFNHQFELLQNNSLPKNIRVQRAYQDSYQNIWTVDNSGGVYLIPKSQQDIIYNFIGKPTKKIGDINNDITVGIDRDGIYNLKSETKIFPNNGKVYQIKNEAIVSDYNTYIKGRNKIQELSFVDNNLIYSAGFKDVIKERDSVYVLTGVNLAKGNYVTQKGRSIQYKAGLLELEKFKNIIYTGGSDGLWQLQNESLVKPKTPHPLINASVNYIAKNDDYLYVATDGRGVYAFAKDTLIPLKNTEDFIVQKIIKKENDLWLATQKGVVQLMLDKGDLANSKITNQFLEADGLLQNNTNDIYLKNDTVYALSDIGMVKINIKASIYKQQPNLYFKTYHPKTVVKKEDNRNISQTFGVKDFTNQENIKYEYRLLPTQENWQPTKTQTLNFSNLSPNSYTLEVKATDQHFNTVTKKHQIIVEPCWYETFWAKIGYGVLALFGLFLSYKLVKKQIEKQEKVKSDREKRIAGLELQALRSQMNPHFVHNSLNAIQYYIQRNEVEQSEDYLARFSKLVREFFEYSRRQTITIADEVSLLQNYLEIEKLRFEDKLSFNIKVDDELDAEEHIIPSMILQPLVENAVNHGLFHKKENGMVTVCFKYVNEDTFAVEVEDDGIGIEKSKKIYKHSAKNYQSRSSAVLQERLSLLQQSKNWQIDYSIKDLSKNSNKTGTLVRIQFKQLDL